MITESQIRRTLQNNHKEKRDFIERVKNKYFGKWAIITGHPRITDAKFKESFPQGIFGKIINYAGGYFILRTYPLKKRGQSKATLKYLKLL
jgi:hypothetical protein